jgi:hypothetical protein
LRLKLLLPAVLTVLLMVSSVQNAFAAVVDQKQENFVGGTGAVTIWAFSPIGQEFQPGLSILEAVEVNIRTMEGGGDDTITLNIRQGSISGTVLATASKSVTEGFEGWVYFALGSISVTTGSTYVIQLSETKSTF